MKRWSDDAYTEPFTAHDSPEYDDHRAYLSMRWMKLLFVGSEHTDGRRAPR